MPLEAAPSMGDMLAPADCLGHTMIVAPTEFIAHLPTVNTKPGEQSPAIRVDVVDFFDPDGPVVYTGVLWFGVLSNTLKRKVGSFLAGRMGQGTASPGRNAPWQLDDITAEADWMAHMNNWLDNTPQGEKFQADAIKATNDAAAQAAAAPAPAAPPAAVAAPAPAAPAARPAPSPVSRPAAPAAPAAPALSSPAPAAPAGDPMAAIAGLPPEELAKVMALVAGQQQAAH